MAQFNDTTNFTGLVNIWESWTRNPSGATTGNLLKEVTADINAAFDELMPPLLAYNDQIRWDDLNHTDAPIGYVTITANQNDYKITTDDNSLDILNITHVRILPSATATDYVELGRITLDDDRVPSIMSPDTSVTGTPGNFLEVGNTLYLDVLPNYTVALGIEIFFSREQSYFASTDTTKEPGIPKPFHELLALKAAHKWNIINRSDDAGLITRLEAKIAKITDDLETFINLRNPAKIRASTSQIRFR